MRWSASFIPTLRDDPADAEAPSHKLLVRAGFMRQLMAGVYSLLPLGFRVTRKITDGVARIKRGLQDKLMLGNLNAQRDWGYAGDYVRAMWMMLRHDQPDDYVIATGVKHSVQDFVELAFEAVELDWRKYVEVDPSLLRPADVHTLCGDASKARSALGWEPEVSFPELVRMMVEADLRRVD